LKCSVRIPAGFRDERDHFRRIHDQKGLHIMSRWRTYGLGLFLAAAVAVSEGQAASTPRIIHISDTHFTDASRTLDSGYLLDSQNSRLRSRVLGDFLINNKTWLRANKVVITGDLTDSGDIGDYLIARAFIERLKSNGFEVYCLPGNHDCSKEGTLIFGLQEFGCKETRRENFSKYVDDCTFPRLVDLHDGWLILLDSLQGEMLTPGKDYWGQGFLGPAQLGQLRSQLDRLQADRRAGKKVIVCLHHSPFKLSEGDLPQDKSITRHPTGGLDDAKEFLSIVSSKVDALLFGHTSPSGMLQQGHDSFNIQRQVFKIPMINCENLEHLPWYDEMELSASAKQVSVAANENGRLEVFSIGPDSAILHNWQVLPNGGWHGKRTPENQPNGGWHGERALGGRARQLCAAENQDGRLEVFYVGVDDTIRHNWQMVPNGRWHGEELLGTHAPLDIPDPAQVICAARNQDGRLALFHVGPDFAIYHNWQHTPGGDWHGEEALGGRATQICVGQNKDGRLEIFYTNPDRTICHNWQTEPNGAWHGEAPLGVHSPGETGGAARQICVERNQEDLFELFYLGMDGEIFHDWQTAPNGPWHGGERMGGSHHNSAQQMCVGQNKDGRLEIFYAGTDSFIYHNYQTAPNRDWSGEETLRGLTEAGRQTCVGRNLDGRLELFYVGTNSKLYHNHQTVTNAAYPITVIDMDRHERDVYYTDSPLHRITTKE
jgi:hypothetical protein